MVQIGSRAYTRTLRLTEADPDQAADIRAFHKTVTDPNDPNLVDRSEAELRTAADTGLLFVVLDGSTIVAAAGAFDVADGYVELGGTGVAHAFRGFRLQRLLAITRISATVAHQGRGTEQTTAIKPQNAPSLRSMTGVGFVPWRNPINEMYVPCGSCTSAAGLTGRRCCCDYYILPPAQKHWNVAVFLSQVTNAGSIVTLTDRNAGGSSLEVVMDTIVATGPHRLDLEDYRRTGP